MPLLRDKSTSLAFPQIENNKIGRIESIKMNNSNKMAGKNIKLHTNW